MNYDFETNDPLNNPDFGLPQDYFQKSAGSVFNKIEWIEEHKEFPRLTDQQKINPFKLPDHYFRRSEQGLELIHYPVLRVLVKENGFTTPPNYFNELEAVQLSQFMGDPESFLEGIVKQNNFKVPGDYFSKNAYQLENISHKSGAKVVSIFNARTAMSIAALLIVALGFWIFASPVVPTAIKDCGTIACIDKADLLKAKNLESLDNDELYELVNTAVLEQKLGEEPGDKNKKVDSLTGDDDLPDEI